MRIRTARRRATTVDDPNAGVVGPSRAEVRAAIETLPENLPWTQMRDGLRPMFLRRRPMPPGSESPLLFDIPVGLKVALGVDIGPAFLYVGPSLLSGWGVNRDEAFEQAMSNLRASVEAERYVEMQFGTVADVPIWWYQSHGGLASGLLLHEDELQRRYGDEPRVLVAPMRNLLLAAPFDADREMLAWLRDEIAAEDPNGLDLPLFAFVNGRLTIDRLAARGATVH